MRRVPAASAGLGEGLGVEVGAVVAAAALSGGPDEGLGGEEENLVGLNGEDFEPGIYIYFGASSHPRRKEGHDRFMKTVS